MSQLARLPVLDDRDFEFNQGKGVTLYYKGKKEIQIYGILVWNNAHDQPAVRTGKEDVLIASGDVMVFDGDGQRYGVRR